MLAIIGATNKTSPEMLTVNKRTLLNSGDFVADLSNETLLWANEAAAKLKNGRE